MHYELSSAFPNINLKKKGKEYLLRVFPVFFLCRYFYLFAVRKASRKKQAPLSVLNNICIATANTQIFFPEHTKNVLDTFQTLIRILLCFLQYFFTGINFLACLRVCLKFLKFTNRRTHNNFCLDSIPRSTQEICS